MERLEGFSQLGADQKLDWLVSEGLLDSSEKELLCSFRHPDGELFSFFEKMTENVISGYHLPFSLAPGFLINGRLVHVPMVVEESSVVAAASWSAKFWRSRGGFQTRVVDMVKTGQIHFVWHGPYSLLGKLIPEIEPVLLESIAPVTERMKARGGGVSGFELLDFTRESPGLFQLRVSFRTGDAMGANFINTCLESMAVVFRNEVYRRIQDYPEPEIIMSILSNYTPECIAECTVECPVDQLAGIKGVENPAEFARRFGLAVKIAETDPYRAVTHNKGIYNGIDSVILATANDFRAVEAAGHAWAARDGSYRSLTRMESTEGTFRYTLTVPMAIGTVGGLTSSHPLARLSLKIMGNPNAAQLMEIAAAAGMANNFSAIKALVTKGIQEGHMRLHKRKSH